MSAQTVLKFNGSSREALFEGIVGSLKGLPRMMREVFVRSHYQSRSTSEIARDLGVSENHVRSMLRDANLIVYRQIHRFRI